MTHRHIWGKHLFDGMHLHDGFQLISLKRDLANVDLRILAVPSDLKHRLMADELGIVFGSSALHVPLSQANLS